MSDLRNRMDLRLERQRNQESLEKGTLIRAYTECHDWHWELKEQERQALAAKIRA